MGTINFLLPSGLSAEAGRELESACVAGGPDSMPWPTQVRVQAGQLSIRRAVSESGCLVVPWEVHGTSRLMGASATLMEREPPYCLEVELARGKLNQLRAQAWEWRAGGLQMPASLDEHLRHATVTFGRAVTQGAADQSGELAQVALNLGYQAADQLARVYTDQVFQIRRQRYPRIDTGFGCRLGPAVLQPDTARVFVNGFNSVTLPFTWSTIEPVEGGYRWEIFDQLLDWAEERRLAVVGGPLIDFSSFPLPDWLWTWERDLGNLSRFMENYVAAAVQRYHDRIRTWQLTSASNSAVVLSLGEDELLWLTVRLVEIARQIDPDLKLIVGIAQPWGEYLAHEERTHSPFVFADTLIRSGLNLAALDLELVMGVTPRGSYCRDLLDVSRLLDMYAILGVPLRVTLAYPSSNAPDAGGDPELRVAAGHCRGGFSPDSQADWAASYAALAVCKPYVQAVCWPHVSDADPHQFPHCGVFDADGQPKPVLRQLQLVRETRLAT